MHFLEIIPDRPTNKPTSNQIDTGLYREVIPQMRISIVQKTDEGKRNRKGGEDSQSANAKNKVHC